MTRDSLPRHSACKNKELNMVRAGLDGPSLRITAQAQEEPAEALST